MTTLSMIGPSLLPQASRHAAPVRAAGRLYRILVRRREPVVTRVAVRMARLARLGGSRRPGLVPDRSEGVRPTEADAAEENARQMDGGGEDSGSGTFVAGGGRSTTGVTPTESATEVSATNAEDRRGPVLLEGGSDMAVEVVDLVKRYPKAPMDSLAGVTFQVRRGEVFGFLGPNGAGKTTTIGILTTRIRPTRGRATVAGVDVVADPVGARRVLGVVPQMNNLDRSLSVRQNLLFHASYHGVPRAQRTVLADQLLEQFGLADRSNGRPDDFSGGQIQRMMIARALMHSPAVLFLDEPSTGLDPAARLFLGETVAELKASGTTVVITTHDMDEAATLSDRVAIIDHGTLLALDTPVALVRGMTGERTLDCTIEAGSGTDAAVVEASISTLDGVSQIERLAEPGGSNWRLRIYVKGEAASFVAPVAQAIGDSGGRLADVRLGEPNLEDVFIHLTGRALR